MTSCIRSGSRASAAGRPKTAGSARRSAIPDIDLAAMARAQGCIGIGPVEDPRRLLPALNEAVAAVRAGKVCVVDVHVAAGYDPGATSGILQRAPG